jgi:hypothetical protein
MDTKRIIEDITSRDTFRVWSSSGEIIKSSHNFEDIAPLIEFLDLITEATSDLEMGGGFAPNSRIVKKALDIIEFHKYRMGCPCSLYEDYYYDGFEPTKEAEKENIRINVEIKGDWMCDYVVECRKCKREFDVIERNGHYTWWKWTRKIHK